MTVRAFFSLLLTGGLLAGGAVFAAGLPEAPTFKQGAIKRGNGAEITLDEKDVQTDIVPDGLRKVGLGTGFFINDSGDLLTNNHVVDGCGFITVEPVTGGIEEGRLAVADARMDLALIRTDFRPESHVRLRAQPDMTRGEVFRVIGYPTKTLPPLKPVLERVTYISDRPDREWMVIRGKVYPGNSGGPAFDQYGRISGVVVAKINTPGYFRLTGQLRKDEGYLIALSPTRRFLMDAGVEYEDADGGGDYATHAELEKTVVKLGCWKDG